MAVLKIPDGLGGYIPVRAPAGKSIEFTNDGTYIKWRYVGDVSWINLIAVADITGPQGIQGIQGEPGEGLPVGGSTDQVLVKKTAADYDVEWRNPSVGITLLDVYPVGSIYLSVNNTNPGTLFGGTWVAWGTGRVPVGVDTGQTEFNTVEKTGGAKDVTLTSSQMPSHTHIQNAHNHTQNSHNHSGSSNSTGAHVHSIRYRRFDISPSSYPIGYHVLRRTDPDDGYDGTDSDAAASAGAHSHTITVGSTTATNKSTTATNQNTGGGESHENLQPYITCYMWKRTA